VITASDTDNNHSLFHLITLLTSLGHKFMLVKLSVL